MFGGHFRFGRYGSIDLNVIALRDVAGRTETLRSPAPVTNPADVQRAGDCVRPVQNVRSGRVGGPRPMEFQERVLEQIVRFRAANREAQAEAVQRGGQLSIQALENVVIPSRISPHEPA
jgi:hypothetical protein